MDQYLIDRLQNFTLNRKIISIHSEDRDIIKYPHPNTFEIFTPQSYYSVESIRLLNIQIPNNLYNISEYLQNNKMTIEIDISGTPYKYEIILNDGYYEPNSLRESLHDSINEKILSKISSHTDNDFQIEYNEVINKFLFVSSKYNFTIHFQDSELNNCLKTNNNYPNLKNILGFKHNTIESNISSEIFHGHNYIISDSALNLNINNYIYMEIEKYNTCDELIPYLTQKYTNVNNGIINSYFAKIPIIKSDYNQSFSGKFNYNENLSYYQPPIERISKLKFKFRYHDGRLVDFQNYNFSFDLEINQIRNEIKNYNVRKPYTIP